MKTTNEQDGPPTHDKLENTIRSVLREDQKLLASILTDEIVERTTRRVDLSTKVFAGVSIALALLAILVSLLAIFIGNTYIQAMVTKEVAEKMTEPEIEALLTGKLMMYRRLADIEVLETRALYSREPNTKAALQDLRNLQREYNETGASDLVKDRLDGALLSINDYYVKTDLRPFEMSPREVSAWIHSYDESLPQGWQKLPPKDIWRQRIASPDPKISAVFVYRLACDGLVAGAAIPALLERVHEETRLDACANVIKALDCQLKAIGRPEGDSVHRIIAENPYDPNNIFNFKEWQDFIDKHKADLDAYQF